MTWAQTPVVSAPMQIRAEVVDGCQIGSVSSGNAGLLATLDFGTESGLASGRFTTSTASSQVATIRCTVGMNLSIRLDAGQHASSGARRMQLNGNSNQHLAYRLCRDAACSQLIAPNSAFSRTISAAESPDVRLNIFADLQLTGNHAAGNYTDLVTITFTW